MERGGGHFAKDGFVYVGRWRRWRRLRAMRPAVARPTSARPAGSGTVMSAVLREPPLRDWYFTVRSAVRVEGLRPGARTRPMSKPSPKPGELVRALERRVLVSVAPVPPAKAADAPPPRR